MAKISGRSNTSEDTSQTGPSSSNQLDMSLLADSTSSKKLSRFETFTAYAQHTHKHVLSVCMYTYTCTHTRARTHAHTHTHTPCTCANKAFSPDVLELCRMHSLLAVLLVGVARAEYIQEEKDTYLCVVGC